MMLASLLMLALLGCEESNLGTTPNGPEISDESASSSIDFSKKSSSSKVKKVCVTLNGESLSCDELPLNRTSSAYIAPKSSSSFKPRSSASDSPTIFIIDMRDGSLYETVTLGEQVWLAENVNLDGEAFFDFSSAQKACPAQTHLPSEYEWSVLFENNDSGDIWALGFHEKYWTSTAVDADSAKSVTMVGDDHRVVISNNPKDYSRAVRCVYGEALVPKVAYLQVLDDRDNQVYEAYEFGGLYWFVQNLNYRAPQGPEDDYLGYICGSSGDGTTVSCGMYGLVYDWSALLGYKVGSCRFKFCNEADEHVQGFCPDGWRLPTKADIDSFVSAVKGADDPQSLLKKFNFVPVAQYAKPNYMSETPNRLRLWSSSEISGNDTYVSVLMVDIIDDSISVQSSATTKLYDNPVRCVRDVE